MWELDERRAVEAMLRRFADRVAQTLFAVEGPDGDLLAISPLLAAARETGVLADPAPEAPGYELGAWGRACQDEGLRRSLLTLSILGEACAGFATAVHAQGLACLALEKSVHLPSATALAAVFTPHYGVPLGSRLASVGSSLQLKEVDGVRVLDGTGHFILAAEPPKNLICFAQQQGKAAAEPEWITLLVGTDVPGVKLTEMAPMQRAGLRAAHQYHLRCNAVAVSQTMVVQQGRASRRSLENAIACDWLGHTAIALGVARRSLQDSTAYTALRYQGGRVIKDHASICLLQGTAAYDIGLLDAILYRFADEPLDSLDPIKLLQWAVQARLAVVEHAHRAVTNCLQTLGGYGYMEDYGFEKRLRDVSTLKSLHGAPDQLRLFLNELTRTS